ncbi:MAG TPA: ABC transporter permease [Bacillota bacterium]|nr:ABC transporter permease [Bacillota bacterium]
MRNAMKVAKWEVKRNLKNKSFIIGLFVTPVLFFGFMLIGSLFSDSDTDKQLTHVFIHDELNIFDMLQPAVQEQQLNWKMAEANVSEDKLSKKLSSQEQTAYLILDERVLDEGTIPVYTSDDLGPMFMNELHALEMPLKILQMKELGFTDEEIASLSEQFVFNETTATDLEKGNESGRKEQEGGLGDDALKRIIPGVFAGLILLSIVFTGMYIFQSASQEKKDKIAEIILSSLTPGELMQGKIIGYFVLGLVQAMIFLAFTVPFAIWKLDIPVFTYLFAPETILLVTIAILGYLLFSALFVGIGATMTDVSSAGQFHGMVLMLPFLPFIFIGPVLANPSGLFAQIGTYIPFTAPGVLLLRLTILEEWPWLEIVISLTILIASIGLFMKLAGKIFKIGILMYGKNATPREIWKWIWA